MKKRAGIVGAGIGGLSAAIRMALKGRQVTVFERAGQAGGKLSEFRKDDFRFDAGPSLLTLPHLIDELFACEMPNISLSGKPVISTFTLEELLQRFE